MTLVAGIVLVVGIVLITYAVYVLSLMSRHWERGDNGVMLVHVALRLGAGLAALWLALGGGAPAAWLLVAFVVADTAFRILVKRRRGWG
jgi:hypothetical protein